MSFQVKPVTEGLLVTRKPADSEKELAKKVHDIHGALRVARFAYDAIQKGYRFDDKDAKAKLESLDRAVSTLEKEIPTFCDLLTALSHSS